MSRSCLKNRSTHLLGATVILLGAATGAAQATTLSSFSTYGSDMNGMRVTANFLNGTSQTLTWGPTGTGTWGVLGNGWSLTQAGNTYPQTDNPNASLWLLGNSGPGLSSLIIDAIPGNTVFDNVPGLGGQLDTPGSAEGWYFQPVSGQAPDVSRYSVPIDISRGDLFGTLSLYWNSGFNGIMQFFADTDSGTTSGPVQPKDPVAYSAPPTLSVSLSTPTIYESQSASACFSAYEPDQTAISFFLNGGYLGTVPNTAGTSSLCTNLGVFPDNGAFNYTVVARDEKGRSSQPVTSTLTVLNIAPTLTGLNIPTIYEGQSASAYLSAVDPGADGINFYLNNGYVGADLNTSGTRNLTTNLGYFSDNTYIPYTAFAQDKDGALSTPVSGGLTVLNVPPTLTSFDLSQYTISEGQSVSALLTATDPGADSEMFFINGNKVGTDLRTSGTRSATTNLGTFKPGTYSFTGQAEDKDGGYSNVITRTLNVLNIAPTITQITKNIVTKANELFNFAVSAFDPGTPSNQLTYQWDFNGDGVFNDYVGASGQWSFAQEGSHTVKVRVSDPYGGHADGSFTVSTVPEEAVPEPSSVLGVLAFSAWGAAAVWKRKRQQQGKGEG